MRTYTYELLNILSYRWIIYYFNYAVLNCHFRITPCLLKLLKYIFHSHSVSRRVREVYSQLFDAGFAFEFFGVVPPFAFFAVVIIMLFNDHLCLGLFFCALFSFIAFSGFLANLGNWIILVGRKP